MDIPPVVRNKAEAAAANDWLDDLPALVRSFEAAWSVSVGEPYVDGTEAYVARATTEAGERAVIKLPIPRADVGENEIAVLASPPATAASRCSDTTRRRGCS